MNTTVTATGMEVTAKSGSSLLIGDNIKPSKSEHNFDPESNVASAELEPLTYEGNAYKYAASAGDVNADTGHLNSGASLTTLSANGQGQYYQDYIVYIANAAKTTDKVNLLADVDFGLTKEGVDASVSTHLACTIDFYVFDATKTAVTQGLTYTGTRSFINAKSASAADTEATEGAPAVDASVVKIKENITIPYVEDNVIPVVMRIYFDGNLDDGDVKYVRSNQIDVGGLNITVTFKTETYVAPPSA